MAKRKSGKDVHGILLLDKREGISSNQALQEVRRLLNANKAGHTGSLDPLATGLLPLCFGEATKVSAWMLAEDKRYQVTINLGIMTNTGDTEGEIICKMPVPEYTEQDLLDCLASLIGESQQIPPMYSALKFHGKKLYELARAGKTVERAARPITIFKLTLLDYDTTWIELDVVCSKGTYIRSLAEDISHMLGTCGTVSRLRRTAAGQFDISQALTFEQLQNMDDITRLNYLIPVDAPLAGIPQITLSREQSDSILLGQQITLTATSFGMVRIYNDQAFLGLGEMLLNGKLAPRKLFHLNNQN